MKVVIAIDSFKGSISSPEAGNAAAAGILRVLPDATVCVKPIADGGEGTTDALVQGMGGTYRTLTVTGPLGTPVEAKYGIVGQTAIIEMAAAAGLYLVPAEARDPMVTTTYGVGELIRDAIRNGIRDFLIGIGGSATNDGGIGMLQALGFGFYDSNGKALPFGARGLEHLHRIDLTGALPELRQCSFRVACDVTNPLCGETGCSAVFSLQKGAKPQDIPRMDAWMHAYAERTKELLPEADPCFPGAGAAGGLGFALHTYLHANLRSGIALVLEQTGIEKELADCDLVITGEGRLDGQTAMGKAPVGVAALAKRYGKPVIAVAGGIGAQASLCHAQGIDAFFPIVRTPCTLQEAMDPATAKQNMTETVEQLLRVFLL